MFATWPHEGCSGLHCSLVEALDGDAAAVCADCGPLDVASALTFITLTALSSGQRVCACANSSSSSNSSKTSRWWIFKNSGDVFTGLGVSSIAAAAAASNDNRTAVDITVFDCTAAVSQRSWRGLAGERGIERASWLFLPWCLPPSSSHQALLRSSFFPAPTLNHDYAHLDAEVPAHQAPGFENNLLILQRVRGVLSLGTAEVLLNDDWNMNATTSSTIVLDCGCCSWVTLLTIADELLQQQSEATASSPSQSKSHVEPCERAVIARLPLLQSSHSRPSHTGTQWACDDVVNITATDGSPAPSGGKLRPALMRIRDAFRIVSWDRLSAEQLHVTLMPRGGSGGGRELNAGRASNSVDEARFVADVPADPHPACAAGDVDVCGVKGCRDQDSARDCLSPKVLDYVKTIAKMCIIRQRSERIILDRLPEHARNAAAQARRICSGLKQDGNASVMKVADDRALLAIIAYAAQHVAFFFDDPNRGSNSVIQARLVHGGLGNLFQPLFAASLMAVMDGRTLLVTLSPAYQQRFEGHFTAAIDVFARSDVEGMTEEMRSGWHVRRPKHIWFDLDYIRCSWGAPEVSNGSTITQIVSGHFPVALMSNHRFHRDILETFGVDADFYLSHFTIVPTADIRHRVADTMAMIRAKYSIVIGVHMRWVTQGT